jgi:hypothetical protein
MEHTSYYRRQAAKARALADRVHQRDAIELLKLFAKEYDEIAEDLESGAVDVRHQERLPQNRGGDGRQAAD